MLFHPKYIWGKKIREGWLYRFFEDRENPGKRHKQNQNENLCPEYFTIEDVQKYTINGEIVIVKYKILIIIKLETRMLLSHSYSGKQNRQLGIN